MRAVLLLSLVLAGCSNLAPVSNADSSPSGFDGAVYGGKTTVINEAKTPDKYRVFSQSATGFVPVAAALNDAETRAMRYCSQKRLFYRVLSETVSTPPHILGNWPRAEILFECVQE